MFQFTRPQGARHQAGADNARLAGFNSRARKGRDSARRRRRSFYRSFNSRAREGRDHHNGI